MSRARSQQDRITAGKQAVLNLGYSVTHLTTSRKSTITISSPVGDRWSAECGPTSWEIDGMIREALLVARRWATTIELEANCAAV